MLFGLPRLTIPKSWISSFACSYVSLSHCTVTKHIVLGTTTRHSSIWTSCRTLANKIGQENLEESIVFSSEKMEVIHLHKTVESTQEEAKRILQERISKQEDTSSKLLPTMIAVLADGQTKGRGTSGRSWVTTQGNLFLTCAFAVEQIPLSKITMLPLGCEIVIADQLALHCSRTKPTLKWPNDVLLDEMKVAGTLIENFTIQNQTWWLVGIGVNLQSHPKELVQEREDALAVPRSAGSLQMFCSNTIIPTAPELGVSIANGLLEFLTTIHSSSSTTDSIVARWKMYAQLGVPYTIRNTGEVVHVNDIQPDGQLRVLGSNGQERFLSTDYFH
ncbi:unnamed protein product [Cylindrotheca closterium]|uniref:BPL/LPL catalytic domain-containing protein n=1 Tax=Cylindrotheca closterium TaxID=2856 RepID=A0AAD2CB31_9STRA|nr:unnamed protein product [Cylindrotheca closterium]